MRNFDVWLKYKDNQGNPLHGCVMFNVKDGNTQAPIFDSDCTPLQNPILTDEYGRTQHQVFVDTDVVAYFYKYIGTGRYQEETNIDVSDQTKWTLQYTAESMDDVTMHITGDSAMCVNTIAELRALDPQTVPTIGNTKTITLLGYHSSGDKSPINYYWNPTSQTGDNSGSIIKSDDVLTGRWIMVQPTEHCDCRHFGIFPSNSQNNTPDSSSQIAVWISYCNRSRIRPYFSAHGDYKFYKYTNIDLTTETIDVANGVTFIDYGTNSFTAEWNGNPLFKNKLTNLVCKYPKTSWHGNQLTGYKVVTIDDESGLMTLQFTGAEVHIDVPIATLQMYFENCKVFVNKSLGTICSFNKCDIFSPGMISAGCYFFGCQLDQNMFYGSPFIHVDLSCTAPLEKFKDKQLMWKRICQQQNKINYDWMNMLTTESPWEGSVNSDRWLVNWKGTNVNSVMEEDPDNAHTYYFENCAGTIKLQGKQANIYVFKNCELVVDFLDGYNGASQIRSQDSTLNFSRSGTILSALNLQNSNLIGSGSFDVMYAYLYNSQINVNVRCGYADVKDCNIGSTINIYGIDQPDPIQVDNGQGTIINAYRIISGNFINNFVNGNIEIGTIDYQDPHFTAQDLVRGLCIKDNVGLSVEPITVHRSFSSLYDNYNIYTYQGNTGTMNFRVDNVQGVININGGNEAHYNKMWEQMGVYGLTNTTEMPNSYLFKMNLFTIGTINVKVLIQIEHNGMMAGIGCDVGCTPYLSSEGTYYWKNMTKSPGGQFEWLIQNLPLFVGMAGESDGQSISFNAYQVQRQA